MGFISFPSNLTKMKFSSALTICAVLLLGLTLSEAKKGGKGGKGKKGIWGKVDDDCKEDLGDAKDSLSCADGSWPIMFKGTSCSDVSVGDEITKPEKPTTKPCSEAANGDTEDMGSSCLLCATKATEERKGKGGKGGKGKGKMVVSSVDGAADFSFTATCQDSKVDSITC